MHETQVIGVGKERVVVRNYMWMFELS